MTEFGMDAEELAYLGGGFSIEHAHCWFVLPDGGIIITTDDYPGHSNDGYTFGTAELDEWSEAE